MLHQTKSQNLKTLRRNCVFIALVWTMLFIASAVKDISREKNSTVEMSRQEALTTFNKDIAFRYWGTKHGGIYVPTTRETYPNRYLNHVVERDVVTPAGTQLTLMNPAWMMRQVMADYKDLYGVEGRITSLKVLNPINEPDDWHRSALKEFERGIEEKIEIVEKQNGVFLRIFRPMQTREGCLKCHGHQGYKVGDVRGGVSVSIPMDPFFEKEKLEVANIMLSHGILWLVGLFALFTFYLRGKDFITEKAEANAAILEKEDRILHLLNSTAEGIYGLDTKGYCTFCNLSGIRLLGYEKEEELLGKHMHSLIHHTRADGSPFPVEECRVYQILQDATGAHYDNQLLWRADGSSFNAEYWSHPVIRDGLVTGVVVTFVDITERVQAVKALHSSEKRFRDLTENSTDWIWECDENDIFTYASPKVITILGLPPEEVVGQTIFDFINKKEKERAAFEFSQFKAERKGYHGFENIYLHKSGRQIYLESSGVPIIDQDGHFNGYRGINRDISERRMFEDQLRQAHKIEAIGTLSGGIAHDFNNILAAILGYAEMAFEDTPSYSPTKNSIEQILKATIRAKDLVHQILVFSRNGGEMKVPTDLDLLVTEALKLLRASIPMTVSIQHTTDGSGIQVMADPTQLHQVIMNLCTNGAQSMSGKGGVLEIDVRSVKLSVDESNEPQKKTPELFGEITIKDDGTGIDEDILERIYDPYFTTKEVGEGSGMGLAVVSGIVKGHDGMISVETSAGLGTTFTVQLPAMEETAVIEETVEIVPVLGTERILVVDDEKSLADITKRRLEKQGYEVTTFTSSVEAFNRFSLVPDAYDLIITDMTMPEMTGESFARQVKNIRPELPIIACSGYSVSMDNPTTDFAAFLIKPIDRVTLAATVRTVLDSSPGFVSAPG